MDAIRFTIPLNPVTKKNSQQIINVGGRPRIIPSKVYREYEESCGWYLPKVEVISHPVNIKALYYMQTRRKVDLCNLHEALHDVLVQYRIIEDDNSNIVVSTDGSRVLYDKQHPPYRNRDQLFGVRKYGRETKEGLGLCPMVG